MGASKVDTLVAYVEEKTALEETMFQLTNLQLDMEDRVVDTNLSIVVLPGITLGNQRINKMTLDFIVVETIKRIKLIEKILEDAESCLQEL